MRDWFTAFAHKRNTDMPECGATRATRATPGLTHCETEVRDVAHDRTRVGNTRATRATSAPGEGVEQVGADAGGSPVAHVAQPPPKWATSHARPNASRNQEVKQPVAHVAHVAQENDEDVASCWDTDDWHAFFHERAGIAESHDGCARTEAEARAFEHCVMEWLWQHPPPASGPERCAHCREPLGEPGRDGLPFLTGAGGHTWLHSGCHGDWTARRRGEAEAVLAKFGLTPPEEV